LEYACALRSIALDEQRTWGGLAMNTTQMRPLELAVHDGASESTYIYEAQFALEVRVSEMMSTRRVGGREADGGKYVAGL
jgi:hypothetical protein